MYQDDAVLVHACLSGDRERSGSWCRNTKLSFIERFEAEWDQASDGSRYPERIARVSGEYADV